MSRFTQFICALLLAIGVAGPVRAQDIAVSVVDFYNMSQDEQWEWLSRGMADMLITDLSSADRLQVVDREGMQRYLDEIELQSGGMFNDQTLIDIGKLAGVDKVIFGTYEVDREDDIIVRATIVDIASQKVETSVTVSGAVSDVLSLEKNLAARLIGDFGVSLSDREKQNVAFTWTESLDATAHFYTALGHYDRGELPLALAESKVAEKIDPDYLPARFWSGRLYLELAEYEHAERYLTRLLREARGRSYKRAYVVHVSLLLAQLYEKYLATPEKAFLCSRHCSGTSSTRSNAPTFIFDSRACIGTQVVTRMPTVCSYHCTNKPGNRA